MRVDRTDKVAKIRQVKSRLYDEKPFEFYWTKCGFESPVRQEGAA